MRTGSVVRPNSFSTAEARTCSASSAASSSSSGAGAFCSFLSSSEQQRVRVRGLIEDLDPHVVDHVDHRLDLVGVMHAFGEVVVDVAIGEESLLFALNDELFELEALGFLLIHRVTEYRT